MTVTSYTTAVSRCQELESADANLEDLRHRLRQIVESGVSPRTIAAQSGVSHATIYRLLGDEPIGNTYRSTVANVRRFVNQWANGGSSTVSHETPSDRPQAVREPAPALNPRVSAGLPHRVRVWLQSELAEYAKAGIPDELFVSARDALESPEVTGFFVGGGGTAGKPPEEDVLEEMKVMARAIRRRLRRGGAKLGPDPVE